MPFPKNLRPTAHDQNRAEARDRAINEAANRDLGGNMLHLHGPARIVMSVKALLSAIEMHVQPHVLASTEEKYEALRHVYDAWVSYASLSTEDRNEFIRVLLKRQPATGQAKTRGCDPIKLLLRVMIRYPTEGGRFAKGVVARDALALENAYANQIPVAEFVARLKAPGAGLASWAEAQRASRPKRKEPSGGRPSHRIRDQAKAESPKSVDLLKAKRRVSSDPQQITVGFSGQKVRSPNRKGRYVIILNSDPQTDTYKAVSSHFLGANKLDSGQKALIKQLALTSSSSGLINFKNKK